MDPDPNAYYSSELAVAAYDLFVGGGLLSNDVDFYLECAGDYGGPVLELGCGTGRITWPLAEAGYDVVGLDISEPMVKLAKSKQNAIGHHGDRVRIVTGDMTSFRLEERFALAIVPARSFQHIVDPALQRAALNCIRRHLVPEAHLVLDLFDPNFEWLFAEKTPGPRVRECRDPNGNLVRRTIIGRQVDPFNQTVREDIRFETLDSDGARVDHEETSWTLRWSLRQEMEYLFELTGFSPVALYSDFRRSPPANGREQLWVLQAS